MPHDSFKVSNQARAAIEEILMYEDRNGATPEDVLLVRKALSTPDSAERGDEPATFLRRNTYLEALDRLLGGFRVSDGTITLSKEEDWNPWDVGQLLLYDRSEILQGIEDRHLSTPMKLIGELLKLRPQIVAEQRRVRNVDEDELFDYALGTLVNALAMGGRIPANAQSYVRLANARDLFDRSRILRGIEKKHLATPRQLILRLAELRPSIVREQARRRRINENNGTKGRNDGNGKKSNGLAFETLVDALIAGGRLTKGASSYARLAGDRDLFEKSPILQGIEEAQFITPEALIAELVKLRPDIIIEQRRLKGRIGKSYKGYALETLARALLAGGRIPGNSQRYTRQASARDLFDRSEILQEMKKTDLTTPKKLMAKLIKLRPLIVEEQRRVRKVDEEKLKGYALGTLARALEAGGRIESSAQTYVRFAVSRDLFDNSKIMQSIPDSCFESQQALLAELAKLLPLIEAEQEELHEGSSKRAKMSLRSLVDALIAGERITNGLDSYTRKASAYDIFRRSPTLQGIPLNTLNDNMSIMRFLLIHRDRIAIENLRTRDEIKEGEVLIPGMSEHYSLNTLINSLHAVGLIEDNIAYNLIPNYAGPLEYFMKRREVVEPQVRHLMHNGIVYGLLNHLDLSLFTYLQDDSKLVGRQYVRKIIKMGRWCLSNPDIITKSIYDARELALLARAPHFIPDRPDLVPEDIGHRLDEAARVSDDDPYGARRDAVEAMAGIVRHHVGSEDPDVQRYVQNIERIVDWNNDALSLSQGILMASAAAALPVGAAV